MSGARTPGAVGLGTPETAIDAGTLTRSRTPEPGVAGASAGSGAAAVTTDPDIEALDLRGAAREGAYALKKAHPAVRFTSGRRSTADQASAMAANVVENRKWIEETYTSTAVSKACQKWVDDNTDATTKEAIAAGLLSVLDEHDDAALAKLSRHLSGDAFDVQPTDIDADAIKKTIRGLSKLDKFLEKEGGLVRWHAQF